MPTKTTILTLTLVLSVIYVQAQVNDSTVNIDNNFRNTLYTSQFGIGQVEGFTSKVQGTLCRQPGSLE